MSLFGGRYRLEEALGAGAQGVAFRVRDTARGGAPALLKVGLSGQERSDGTLAEFEALYNLHAPWVVPVLELGFAHRRDLERLADYGLRGSEQARPYLVRAWVQGPDLLTWAQQASRAQEDTLALLAALALALEDLHRAGLTHGDLKPEHVLVTAGPHGDEPRLIDFGLASRQEQGAYGGTPGYMAPERLRGEPARPASDRFALGVTLAQALLGARASISAAAGPQELPQALLDLGLPRRALRAIAGLLHPEPQGRPPLREVHQALLPPSQAVQGALGASAMRLPFLGLRRRQSLDALVQQALHEPGALPPVVLLVAPAGAGRSRALRLLGWNLQRQGRPALEVHAGAQPWEGLLRLGQRLGSLAEQPFVPPSMQAEPSQRARWLLALSQSLAASLPQDPTALLWDDPGADLLEGVDPVEALALLLEQASGRLRLWLTATPEHAAALRSLFASVGFLQVELPPLERGDLDGLLGLENLGHTLAQGDLDRAWQMSQGHPAALTQHFDPRCDENEVTDLQGGWSQQALCTLAASSLEGLDNNQLLELLQAAGLSLERARQALRRALSSGTLYARGYSSAGEPRWGAPLPLSLPGEGAQRRQLAAALSRVQPQSPRLLLTVAALRGDAQEIEAHWREHGQVLRRSHSHALRMTLLEQALGSAHLPALLEDYLDTALHGGQPERALEHLRRSLQGAPSAWGQQLRLALARLEMARGADPGPWLEEPVEQAHEAARASLLSQMALRRGLYAQARAQSAQALAQAPQDASPALRAELEVTAAVASAMLGEGGEAALQQAHQRLKASQAPARQMARFYGMWAMVLTLRGDLDASMERYQDALGVVERHGLDADRPLALLNLGTGYERQGRLGLALRRYTQGARASLPTTRASTRALLLANRANLEIKLGRPGEARELLAAAGRVAQEARLGYVLDFVAHLEADADAAEGKLGEARAVYQRLAQGYAQRQDQRHACELYLKAGQVCAQMGEPGQARELLESASAQMEGFEDFKPRAECLRALLEMAEGPDRHASGLERLLKALDRAYEAGDDLLILTQGAELLRRSPQVQQDAVVLDEIRRRLDRSWRRVALALTPDLRRELQQHLGLEASLAPSPPLTVPSLLTQLSPSLGDAGRPSLRPHSQGELAEISSTWQLAEKFYRMLSLNRRIIGETELDRLIPAALEIALELSGAERGFVLLRQGPEQPFEVAFSRDVDGRPIAPERLQISETVARQVAASGEAVVTLDASQDARFGQARSVQHFSLTSILCVPVRDRERVLGCLYLDQRQQAGVFTGHSRRMIEAFADQVAVALLRARQVEALRRERDALARAQSQIQELLREKEERVVDLSTRCQRLEEDLARERDASGLRYDYSHIVAQAPSMRRVLGQLDRVLDSVLPLVIRGESGTGKELIARAAHFNGPRRRKPFVAINCGALSETLLESELFGHKKGAFTGATEDRKGLFEAAHGGTLFLDEVGEMSLAMQVKLLRALQERSIRPVGATREVSVDVRVLAATHRDLLAMVQEGSFRQDLYYRLATLVLELPPLRQRVEDIPLLVRHLLRRACQDSGLEEIPQVRGEAVAVLSEYAWPGNIRQLENVVRAALVLSQGEISAELVLSLLPREAAAPPPAASARRPAPPPRREGPRRLQRPQRGRPRVCSDEQVLEAMEACQEDRARAAARLGISTRTLQRYLSDIWARQEAGE